MLIAQWAHDLFLCIGFSFSGCYSSQQLSQNSILLTTIKFKTFQDYFIKGFQGLEFGPIKFKAFQGPVWTLSTAKHKVIFPSPQIVGYDNILSDIHGRMTLSMCSYAVTKHTKTHFQIYLMEGVRSRFLITACRSLGGRDCMKLHT